MTGVGECGMAGDGNHMIVVDIYTTGMGESHDCRG